MRTRKPTQPRPPVERLPARLATFALALMVAATGLPTASADELPVALCPESERSTGLELVIQTSPPDAALAPVSLCPSELHVPAALDSLPKERIARLQLVMPNEEPFIIDLPVAMVGDVEADDPDTLTTIICVITNAQNPEVCQGDYEDPCETTHTDLCNQLAQLGSQVGDALGRGLAGINDGRETGTSANDGTEVYGSSGSRVLETVNMDGQWKLSILPSGIAGIGEVVPTDNIAGFSLSFPDSGEASQPTGYSGDNPAPGNPWINEPPPSRSDIEDAWMNCGYAMMVAAAAVIGGSIAIVASAGTATGGAIVVAAVAGGVAGGMCGTAVNKTNDYGRWAADGSYSNCWGCGGNTRWDGHILNVPGIVEITSSIEILDPKDISTPYGNADSNGYYEQQEKYQQLDQDTRAAAVKLHNTFREQIGGATAAIEMHIPLLEGLLSGVATSGIPLGQTQQGNTIYLFIREGIIGVDCVMPCSDSAILSITSPGTGALTPGDQGVNVDFAGTPGEATINLLGLQATGFTLDGEMGGGGSTGDADSLVDFE